MSKYENLIKKANDCREVAKRTRGEMSIIWLSHALKLEEKARALLNRQANEAANG